MQYTLCDCFITCATCITLQLLVIKHNDIHSHRLLTDMLSRKFSSCRLYISSILVFLWPRTLDLKSNVVRHAVNIAIGFRRVEWQLAATIATGDVFFRVENA